MKYFRGNLFNRGVQRTLQRTYIERAKKFMHRSFFL